MAKQKDKREPEPEEPTQPAEPEPVAPTAGAAEDPEDVYFRRRGTFARIRTAAGRCGAEPMSPEREAELRAEIAKL